MKPSEEITLREGIPYLGADRAEKMDAYLPGPAFPGPHAAVVLIHGGGWRTSHRGAERERKLGRQLARAGYAAFSIDYLLNVGEKDETTGRVTLSRMAWPQNFYDCKTAVRYLRAHAQEYNLNPDKIAVTGGSAGAHLAMLVGSTMRQEAFNREGLYTDQSNHVSCVIPFYGEYDLRALRHPIFPGATPEETEANHRAASPMTWIDRHTAPMLIIHGADDRTFPPMRSRLLADLLKQYGVDFCLVELGNTPHTFGLHTDQLDLEPLLLTFLAKHLGPPPA